MSKAYSIKNSWLEPSESFEVFYKENFKTLTKCLWSRDNSITPEDMAQEALLYLWQTFFSKKLFITFDGEFYTPQNQAQWLRMKCRQLISNQEQKHENNSKYTKVGYDVSPEGYSEVTPEERNAIYQSTSSISLEETKALLASLNKELRANFEEEIAEVLFFLTIGYTVKETEAIASIGKTKFYNAMALENNWEVYELVKEKVLNGYRED